MVNPLILGSVLEIGKDLIDRIVPNATEKAKAEAEFLRAFQDQEFKTVLAQLEVNAKEAQHASIFVAGWRPWIGWICGMSLAYSTMFVHILAYIAAIKGWPAPPKIDTELLQYILFALLGVGTMRSVEKIKGATK